MNKFILRNIVAASLIALVPLSACNKKEEGQQSAAKPAEEKAAVAQSLVSRIPADSVAFMHWDTKTDAYKKYRQSPWGQQDANLSSDLGAANSPALASFLELLRKAGVNIDDPQQVDQILGEGVIFGTVAADGGAPGASPDDLLGKLSFGALVHPQKPSLSKSVGQSIRTFMQNEKYTVENTAVTGGEGFTFSPLEVAQRLDKTEPGMPPSAPLPPTMSKLSLVWTDDYLVLASAPGLIAPLLTQSGAPSNLLSSPAFTKAAAQILPKDERYALGWIDVAALVTRPSVRQALERSSAAATGSPEQSLRPEELPVEGIVLATGFSQTPVTEGRILFNPKTEGQKRFASGLGKSTAKEVFRAIPKDPLLVVALDGNLIRALTDSLQMPQGAPMALPALDLVKQINAIAVSVKAGNIGQSFLPIPDVVALIETPSADMMVQTITTLSQPFLQDGQAGGMQWEEKQVAGVPAKALQSPFGFGLLLATKGNLVIAASTEPQLAEAIQATGTPSSAFLSGLQEKSQQMISGPQTISGFYVNMVEVATVMENMGSMLSQFAPPSPDAPPGTPNELFTKDQIARLKKLGTLVTSISFDGNTFVLRSQYEQRGNKVAMLETERRG